MKRNISTLKHLYTATGGLLWMLLCILFLLGCSQSNKEKEADETLCEEAASCKALFLEGRNLQRQKQYSEAIALFNNCANYSSDHQEICQELQPIVIDALLQLVNSYQSLGRPNDCVDHLMGILNNPTPLLKQYGMRDLYSLTGYALSRTEAMKQAEEYIAKALSLPLYHPTHERLFRDYAYAAAINFSNPQQQEQVIQWCLMAINENKLCAHSPGVQWVTSMLGVLYKRTGQFNEAIDLFTQSIHEAQSQNDPLGEMNACNSMSDLFLYWGLPQFADNYANHALCLLEKTPSSNPMIQSATYQLKGQAMGALGKQDSALIYWKRAEEICKELPYNSGQADIDYYVGLLLIDSSKANKKTPSDSSFVQGMKRLQRASSQATTTIRAKAFFGLAQGYLSMHQKQQGETMLDSMFHQLHLASHPLYIDQANSFALGHYIQENNQAQIIRYAQELLNERKQRDELETSRKLAETIIQYQVERKEQELQLARTQLDNHRLYLLLATLILLLLCGIAFIGYRLQRMKHKLMEQRLNGLIHNLNDARMRNQEIKKQLTDLLADISNRNKLEAATPQLLHEKGEGRFRQRFEQFYPTFLPTLRNRIPSITRNEELLCMLLALGQDTFQIEQLLGIAHRSVIMARHRLYKKISAISEQSLEAFAQEILDACKQANTPTHFDSM